MNHGIETVGRQSTHKGRKGSGRKDRRRSGTGNQDTGSSTNGNVNIDGKEVVVYAEPENVLHDEDVEDFSAEEIAALLAD